MTDRSARDYRYIINSSKIEKELGWKTNEKFDNGMRKIVEWYLNNWEK